MKKDSQKYKSMQNMKETITLEQVKEIQTIILEIYKEFVVICKKHNIRYFAIGGTAIGAVRHNGFIPWDDDLDVAMPRKDYEKFCKIARTELSDKYRFIDHLANNKSGLMFGKISDETTTDVEPVNISNPDSWNGVFMDVFPLDGAPTSYLLFRLHMLRLKIFYYAIWAKIYTPDTKKSTKGKSILKNISRVLTEHTEVSVLKQKFIKLASKYDFDNPKTKYLARTWALSTHHGLQALARYDKEDFNKIKNVKFEDTEISLPAGYDNYLSSLYPNYMELPPKEQQKPSHCGGILDLEHSYKYYIAKKNGKTIGYVPGSFDMFHVGHLNIIRKAKQQCDYLIVGVNSDALMYSNKNKYPIVPELERLGIISALGIVDEAFIVDTPDKLELYEKHKFDVLFVGDDYKGKWDDLEKKLEKNNAKIHYMPYTIHTSSTMLREALHEKIKEKAIA